MNIVFDDTYVIRGDGLIESILRFDMTPMPSTVEFTVRSDNAYKDYLVDGGVFTLAEGGWQYRIVKVKRNVGFSGIQGNKQLSGVHAVAFLDTCKEVTYLSSRAVIMNSTSFGDVYRSLGCKVNIGKDLPLNDFACFAGRFASEQIAKQLHQEGAGMWFDGNRLNFQKCREMLQRDPVMQIPYDHCEHEESGFKLRHQVPTSYTTGQEGNIKSGQREKKLNGTAYAARESQSQVNNKQEFFIRRRIATTHYNNGLQAGQVVQVEDKPHVILTAVHTFTNSGGSTMKPCTRLWLGTLND